MNKVFSYCLFEPKELPSHRDHDPLRDNASRYWFNIPAVILSNALLYPDYVTRIYLSSNVWKNELSTILSIIAEEVPSVDLQNISDSYVLTEPAIWRMKPLWDRDVSVFHCRDLDSIPTLAEYRFVKAFESSRCSVGTLRTHPRHQGIKCRILAGLCSFKPALIEPEIKPSDFKEYYDSRHDGYGSDQDLLIETFTSDWSFSSDNFLDMTAQQQTFPPDFPCQNIFEKDMGDAMTTPSAADLFSFSSSVLGDFWAGEPLDARGPYTHHLLDLFPNLRNRLVNHSILSDFYVS